MTMALKHGARRIGWLFLTMLALVGCDDDPSTSTDAGAENNDSNNDDQNNAPNNDDDNNAGDNTCEPSPEPIFVAFGGPVFDPFIDLEANDERAVVVWQDFSSDSNGAVIEGPVLTANIAADQSQRPEPQTLFDPDAETGEINGGVTLARQGDGFAAVWNQRTGPGELDFEVRVASIDAQGQPERQQALAQSPALLLGVGPGERQDQAFLVATWPPPTSPNAPFDLWTEPGGQPIKGELVLDGVPALRARSLRMVGLANGNLAALYEKEDAPGVFWESLSADNPQISGEGRQVSEGGISRRARVGRGHTAFFDEGFLEGPDGNLVGTQIKVTILDDDGQVVADVVLDRDEDANFSALAPGDLLFDEEGQLVVMWTRFSEDSQTETLRAHIASATFDLATGQLTKEPADLVELSNHAELSDAPGGFAPALFARSANNRVGVLYSTEVFRGSDDETFTYAGLTSHFVWVCVP